MRWNYHLNFPSRITYSDGRVINYVYSASGAKLKVSHKPSGIGITTTTDYVNGYIFTNDSLSMALTDNGYFTLSGTGVPTYHFYLKDHQGNNRVVVSQSGSVEQITHYYPYGGVIGDISTLLSDVTKGNNESLQKYKLFHYIPREQARSEGPRSHQKEIDNLLARRRAFRRGVELDRTFGLDNYDIHARQYFAMAPMWDKSDSKAEDYYPISPYAYCGGDPVNNGDGHEFGHLIGLKDRYAKLSDEERKLGIEPPPDPGWEDTMMGSKSGFGTTKNPNMQLKVFWIM